MKGFLKIFFAIFLALTAAYFVRVAFVAYTVKQVATALEQSVNQQAEQQRKRLEAQRQQLLAEQERRRTIALQEERARMSAQRDAAAKEQAWNTYYKEPKGCTAWQSDKQMVDCINNKMEQKQAFERDWIEGKIKSI